MPAHQHTEVTRTTTRRDDDVPEQTTRKESHVYEDSPSGTVLAERIIYYILGVIEVLLVFRLVLALLGANRANDFAQFIFNLSQPFVQPFFSLFGYQPAYGVSRLEIYTLVAMAVYAVIAWGIVALIRLPRNVDEE